MLTAPTSATMMRLVPTANILYDASERRWLRLYSLRDQLRVELDLLAEMVEHTDLPKTSKNRVRLSLTMLAIERHAKSVHDNLDELVTLIGLDDERKDFVDSIMPMLR